MRLFASTLFAALLAACASNPSDKTATPAASAAPAETSPGSSFATAILIKDVKNTEAGIKAENACIREHFDHARKTAQALIQRKGKAYDVITIELPNRESRDIYFDITAFFGKNLSRVQL